MSHCAALPRIPQLRNIPSSCYLARGIFYELTWDKYVMRSFKAQLVRPAYIHVALELLSLFPQSQANFFFFYQSVYNSS